MTTRALCCQDCPPSLSQTLRERLTRIQAFFQPVTRRVVESVTLPDRASWSAVVGRGGGVIHCQSGTIWVTQEGELEDHILSGPTRFVSSKPGRIGVMALGPARFTAERQERVSRRDRSASGAGPSGPACCDAPQAARPEEPAGKSIRSSSGGSVR